MFKKSFAVAAAGALLLAGCAAPAPAVQDGPKEFATVLELRDAFVEAGGACPDWDQTNSVKISAQSGVCDTSTVLSVYLSKEAVERRVEETKGSIFGTVGGDWLVGENWIVNADELGPIKEKLGGQIVSFEG